MLFRLFIEKEVLKVIVDDSLLYTSDRKSHKAEMKALLKA